MEKKRGAGQSDRKHSRCVSANYYDHHYYYFISFQKTNVLFHLKKEFKTGKKTNNFTKARLIGETKSTETLKL